MLPKSRQPQVIRLHSLEDYQRQRFGMNYLSTITDLFPSAFKYKMFSHPMLKNLLPDVYFTFVTICVCRKRLGQEYTYVTMSKDQHYENEGVLVNKKYRTLVFVLEIIGRNMLPHLMNKVMQNFNQKVNDPALKAFLKCIGNTSDIMSNIQWFLMMLFMLNLTKSPNLIDVKLGLGYIYTFFNENQTQISYKMQGMLLLAVFIVKFINFFFNLRKQIVFEEQKVKVLSKNQNKINLQTKYSNNQEQTGQPTELCRICYDQIKQKSCTKCGHTFCWQCIVKSLQFNNQCPVCRTKCLPRQVIQLVNF